MRHIVPCRQPPPGPDNVSLTRVLIRLFQTTKRACIYGCAWGPQLRGLTNVAAEWTMLATGFNLHTLCRVWSSSSYFSHPSNGPEPCPVP